MRIVVLLILLGTDPVFARLVLALGTVRFYAAISHFRADGENLRRTFYVKRSYYRAVADDVVGARLATLWPGMIRSVATLRRSRETQPGLKRWIEWAHFYRI